MKTFYYFLIGICLIAFGFSNVAKTINTHFDLVYRDSPSLKKQEKPLPKKYKKVKSSSKTSYHNSVVLPPSMSATNSVAVQGGGNAAPGGQLNYTVLINNSGTDATGVVYTDVLNSNLTLVAGSLTSTPIAVADSYTAIGNVGIAVNAASGLLANDISPLNLAKTATVVSNGTSANGAYTIATDGSFTYTPNAGYTGSDSFNYTINTGTTSSTGTVNVTVSGVIWFVNAAVGNSGNGTLASPFKAISNITGTSAGHTIFLYTGTYTGSFTLSGTQKLIGQGATASLSSITGLTFSNAPTTMPSTGGTNPTWNTAALTLGSGNDVEGINFNSTTGTTMTGVSVGALKVQDVSLNNTAGQALQITTGGALDVQFKSISAAGASKGISVNNSTGNFQVLGTGTTAGSGGIIQNITTRGAEFSNVSNITLTNMNFTNSNTTSAASSATDYATANGAITLNNVSGVTLTKVVISGTTRERGITGKTISNFTLNGGSTLTDCGDDVNEGCLYLQELTGTCNINDATLSKGSENIARVFNSSGTLTLNIGTDATTTIFNDSQTQNVNMASPGALSALRSYCFIYTTSGSSTATATLNTRNTSFLKAGTHGFKIISDGMGTVNANIKSCTFNNDNATFSPNDQAGSIEMTAFNTANLNYNILNNSCRGKGISLINIVAQVNSFAQGRINDNTVVVSGSGSAGEGIRLSAEGSSDITTEVARNNVSGMGTGVGILATATGGDGKMNATINNNTVTITDANASHNIQVQAGNSSSTFSNTLTANVINNITTRPDLSNGFNFRVRVVTTGTHKLYLQGPGTSAEQIWTNNGNTTAGAVVAQAGTYGTQIFTSTNAVPASLATCALVSNPTYFRVAIMPRVIDSNDDVKSQETAVLQRTDVNNSTQQIAVPMAGETITVNGAGSGFSLPAGKSTTIKFSATISTTPTACPIPDQGTVSGSNFSSVQTNLVNTTLTLAPINPVTPTSTPVCSGSNITVTAIAPAGIVTWYTAASGGSAVATGSTFSPTNITTATSYFASCVVGTCESARTLVRSVTINTLPTASPSSNTPVCSGRNLNLTSPTASSYLWSGPNTFTSTEQNPIISATSAAAGTYTLTITNASGCSATATTQVVVNTILAPTATASQNFCATATVANLVATGTGTINWYNVPTGGTALSGATALFAGTYYASQTVGGCESNTRASVAVTINTVASPSGSASQSFSTPGITLTDLVVTGTNVVWFSSAANAQANINPLPTNTILVNNTTYYAMQTIGTCRSNSPLSVQFISTVLNTYNFALQGLEIYPNPVSGELTIKSQTILSSVEVINLLGQQVGISIKPNANNITLDMSSLQNGVYLVKLTSNIGHETIKVLKN